MNYTSIKKHLFSLKEYHQLTEMGFFQPEERLELIRGEIFSMAAKGVKHRICCTRLLRLLSKVLQEEATLQCQEPITLPSISEPEPDLTILKNQSDDYSLNHPTPPDILLVIEISDSSYDYDSQIKLQLYAEAAIQDYWIFNLRENQLETYQQPYQKINGDFAYQTLQIFLPNQSVSLPVLSGISLDLWEIFREHPNFV